MGRKYHLRYPAVFLVMFLFYSIARADTESVCCSVQQTVSQPWSTSYLVPFSLPESFTWLDTSRCRDSKFVDPKTNTTIQTKAKKQADNSKCFGARTLVCCEIVAAEHREKASIGWIPSNSCPRKLENSACEGKKGEAICCAWKSKTSGKYFFGVVLRAACAQAAGAMVVNEETCPDSIPEYQNFGPGADPNTEPKKDH